MSPSREQVLVVLRREPGHPRAAQGLRAAVGYLAAGARVRVVLCGAARALLGERLSAPLQRHVDTLRLLGEIACPEEDDDALLGLAPGTRVVVW